LAKPGSADSVVEAITIMKSGGMEIGIILMVGIGGETYRDAHFADTIETIQRMPLGSGDLVYLSPFVADEPSPYLRAMEDAAIALLDASSLNAEEQRFKAALVSWAALRNVRVSHYDVRELIY